MPGLSFVITREDMLRSKVIEPGWYKVVIKNVTQEPAKTDGSTNTWVDMVITDGPSKDVPLRKNFSEKAPGFAVPFLAALGTSVGEQGMTVDMSLAKGKSLLVYVLNKSYNNQMQNSVEDFKSLTAA